MIMVSSTLTAGCIGKRAFGSSIYSDKVHRWNKNVVHLGDQLRVLPVDTGCNNLHRHRCKKLETVCLISSSGQLPGAKIGGNQLHIGDARWCCNSPQQKTESHLFSRKWGVNSAVRNNVAVGEVGEEVTEDEESFHRHTTRDDAYWNSVMQAITMDASAPRKHEDSKRLESMEGGQQSGTVAVENIEKQSQENTKKNSNRVVKHSAEGEASTQHSGTWKEAVSTELKVSLKQLLQFERRGHVLVRQLVPEKAMEECAQEIWTAAREQELDAYRHRVAVLCPRVDASSVSSIEQALAVLAEHATDELGFLQMFNLHRYSPGVRELVTSPRLARVAADLLGASRVRLYQDCLFLKQPGFGATNWHSDLNMVPLDTNAFVTLWIPLRAMEDDDSALLFASGSHRDFALAYWQDLDGMEDLEGRQYPLDDHGALHLGDATCHHGWCLHYASPQPEESDARAALSVSYFADGARVLDTRHTRRRPHDEDAWSFRGWRQALQEGDLANHPLLPLVYPATSKNQDDIAKQRNTKRESYRSR